MKDEWRRRLLWGEDGGRRRCSWGNGSCFIEIEANSFVSDVDRWAQRSTDSPFLSDCFRLLSCFTRDAAFPHWRSPSCIFAIFISDFVRKRPIFTLPCTFDSIPISLDARSHGAVAVVGGLSFRLIGWTETFSVKETVSQQCNRTDCRRNAKERAWHGQRQPKWYVAYENTGIQQFLHLKFLIYFIWGSLTIGMHSADQKKSELILLAFPFIGIIAWAVGFWNCFLNFSFKLKE